MKREILFKGKSIHTKEWVQGSLINYNPKWNPRIIFEELIGEMPYPDSIEGNVEVYPESVSQFTGFLDEEGKKIFENDLYVDEEGDKWKVFQKQCGMYALVSVDDEEIIDDCIMWDKVLITGNIHDETNT